MGQTRSISLDDALALLTRDFRAGNTDRARRRSAELARRFPGHAGCWVVAGRCGLPDQRNTVRRGAIRALTLSPDLLDAYLLMCHLFQEADPWAARRMARWAVTVSPQSERAQTAAALVANRNTASGSTTDQARRSAVLSPHTVRGWTVLGDSSMGEGDTEAAGRAYRRALFIEPSSPAALYSLSTSTATALAEEIVVRTVDAAESGTMPRSDLEFAGFALGAHFDRIGDEAAAFRWYSRANAAHRESAPPDMAGLHRFLKRIAEIPWLTHRGSPPDGPTPIFIVGLPGSGTTMVESILSMHPAVTAAGELGLINSIADTISGYPDAMARLSAGRPRTLARQYLKSLDKAFRPQTSHVTDKMPTNFFHLGLIRALFPNAPIIHTRRDPMAVAWSTFCRRFTAGHDYAYDLRDIAEFIDIEHRFMAHWNKQWPGAIHTVSFEELLGDPEPVVRSLLARAGLDWHAACLDFHQANRRVTTASALAVRQPVNRSTRDRWRRYIAYLEPVRQRLGIAG